MEGREGHLEEIEPSEQSRKHRDLGVGKLHRQLGSQRIPETYIRRYIKQFGGDGAHRTEEYIRRVLQHRIHSSMLRIRDRTAGFSVRLATIA